MKISIAMATYDGERYIEEQLNSFLTQSRLPDEIIISDDHSTDKTIEILNSFKKSAPFEVKIIENEKNLGYTKNFEKALMSVTGDIIFMSDQDDVWFNNKIEQIEELVKKKPNASLFIHDVEITNSNLESNGVTKMEQYVASGKGYEKMDMGACTVIRRELLQICLPIPNDFRGHDTWIHNVVYYLNKEKVVTRSCLQFYRIHNSNTSENSINTPERINLLNRIQLVLRELSTRSKKLEYSIQQKKTLLEWLLKNKKYSNDVRLNDLKNQISACQERVNTLRMSRVLRLKKIRQNLKVGTYSYFNGFYSAFYDFLAK